MSRGDHHLDNLIRRIDDALEDWSTRDAKEPSDQVAVYLAHRFAAIEREARQQALTDAIAAVEGMPMTFGVHTCWDDHMGEGGAHEDGSECHDRILGESVGRAAVIDTLTRLRGGS